MDRLNFPMQKVVKNPERVRFDSGGGGKVSALFLRPEDATACYILAHGAGAGMTHPELPR